MLFWLIWYVTLPDGFHRLVSKLVPAIGPMKFGWPTDVFWLRYEKYHQTLSFLIGPPTLMFVSRYFSVSLLCGRMLPPGFVTGS